MLLVWALICDTYNLVDACKPYWYLVVRKTNTTWHMLGKTYSSLHQLKAFVYLKMVWLFFLVEAPEKKHLKSYDVWSERTDLKKVTRLRWIISGASMYDNDS